MQHTRKHFYIFSKNSSITDSQLITVKDNKLRAYTCILEILQEKKKTKDGPSKLTLLK